MLPVQITIRDMPESPALEDHIRKKVMKLSQYCRKMNSCRVVIHVTQKHKHQGKLFSVHIDLTVPGKELAVNHKSDEDVYVAVRDSFNALKRQVECYDSKHRGAVKNHEMVIHGHVKRLFPDEGYGFILGTDGDEYYFSMANVSHPDFLQLHSGDAVEFLSVPGGDGPQAHRVTRAKNGHALIENE